MLKEIAEQPTAVADTLRRALRGRPHRAGRAAALRSGTARDRQGFRRRLRHRLPLRAAGQIRDRALDPAARRGGAGQRVPLPRPGAGPQHAGGCDLAVRRDRRHPGGRAARQGAEGQGPGDLQHQRLARSRGNATRCSTPAPARRSAWRRRRRSWPRSPRTTWSGSRSRRPAGPSTPTRSNANSASWSRCPIWWPA